MIGTVPKEKRKQNQVFSAASRFIATGLSLSMTSDTDPFRTAWDKNLGEQSIINNIPKEALNSLCRWANDHYQNLTYFKQNNFRIIGWSTLDLVLYGGNGFGKGIEALFGKRRRKR